MLEILDLRAYARAYTEVMRAQDDSQVSPEARHMVAPVLEQLAAERAARRGR